MLGILLFILKFVFIFISLIIIAAIFIVGLKLYRINRESEISTIGYLLPRERRALEKAKKRDIKGRWMALKSKLDLTGEDTLQSSILLCENFIVEAINAKGIKGNNLKDLLKEAGFKGFEGIKNMWEAYKVLHIEKKSDLDSLKSSLTNYILGIEDMIDFGLVKK